MEWVTDTPSKAGYYGYRNEEDVGIIEIAEFDGILINGETSEPVESMAKTFPITHWCGPVTLPEFE